MPLTIQAIVCTVDFSSFSPLVIRHGTALARRAGVRLFLIHAVHHPQDRLHPTTVFERGGGLTHLTDVAKQRISKLMKHAAVDWEAVVRFGDPVEQTVAFVNSLPPSLVVSASHGVSGFRRLFIGTVVERLTRALNRPMLVVKPGDDEDHEQFSGFRRAVVSCDGHGHWQRLAPLLPLLQHDEASQIHLVHSMEAPMDKAMKDFDAASYGQVQQALQDRLNRGLREQARRMFPHVDQLSVEVAPGVPQEMVLRIVREEASDMIVVGVRRSGKVGRWISGSTTEALLRRSPCCVLTVPEPVEPEKIRKTSSMTTTGVVWDPFYLDHVTDEGHPEHPRRLKPIYRRLQDPMVNCRFTTIVPPAATDEEILLVHSPSYLKQVKATVTCAASALSADTLTCDRSYAVAALAAGGTIEAIRQVVAGTLSHALVLARPPGHHAERTRAMGYCIFNNVAIGSMAARTTMGLARVMVVDWDLHHGNGTQHIFERDPSVFFFSSHQFPHYPGTGHLSETGQGPGEGTTMNIPLNRGCGDGEFAAMYQRILIPVVHAFKPDLILVSAGFDIHAADPLGGMKVTPAGFAGLTRLILDVARQNCAGRVVFCLEGGYDANALADSAMAMIDELTGRTCTDVDAMAASADPGRWKAIVDRCIHTHQRFWKELDG